MKKILLVEDDLFLRDIYTEVLTDEKFIVEKAVDGEEALQKIKQGNWDMVLMDIVMPKVNGIEVLRQINGNSRKYARHIVMMTNSDVVDGLEEVKGMIDGCLLKTSFTPGEFVNKIKQYFKNEQAVS